MTQTLLARYSLSQGSSLTPLQSQVDGLVGSFVEQATDLKSLAAMTAGGMAYRFGRMGVMATGAGRLASLGIGLGAEVTAFEMTNRSLSSLTGDTHFNPNLWRWDGQGGIRQGLLSSLVTFGTLKGAGHLAQGENVLVQHLLQDTGMVLGHQVSGSLGITDRPQGTLVEQFLHAEVTNLQLAGGMALAHHFAPGIQGLERGLDLALQTVEGPQSGEETSPLHQPAFAATGIGSVGARDLNIKGPTILQMSATENGEESGTGGSSAPAPSSEAPQAPVVIIRRESSSEPRKIDPQQTLAVLPMGTLTPLGNERTTYQRAMGDPQWMAEVGVMNGYLEYRGDGVYADKQSGEILDIEQIAARYGEAIRLGTGFRELKSDLPIETPWAGQIPAGLRGEEGSIEKRLLEVMGLRQNEIKQLRFNQSSTLIARADQFALQGLYALFRSAVRWGANLDEIIGHAPERLGVSASPGLGGMNHLSQVVLAAARRNEKRPYWTEPRTQNMWLPSMLADSMQGVLIGVLGPKYEGSSIGPNPVDIGACATGYKAFVQAADMFRPQWPGGEPVELAIFGSSEAPHGHPHIRPSATGFNAMGAMETIEDLGKRLGLAPDEFRKAMDHLERHYAPMTEQVYGFWPSEGAGIGGLLILARGFERGLPFSSGVAGYAMRGDQGGKKNPADIGYGGRNALRTALRMAEKWQGLNPDELDYISGHLTGTPTSNAAEAALLAEVLSPRARAWLVAFKALLGHGLGAAGSMEMGLIQAVLETGKGPGAFNLEGRELATAFKELYPRIQISPNPIHGIRFAGGQSQGFAGNNAAALFRGIDDQIFHEVYGYEASDIDAYRRRLSERQEVSHRWEEAVRTGKPVGKDIDPEHGDEPATIGKFLSWFGLSDKPPTPPTIVDMAPSQAGGTPGETARPPETVRAIPSRMQKDTEPSSSSLAPALDPQAAILDSDPELTTPTLPPADGEVRGPEIMTRTIFPIAPDQVVVTLGEGAGITPLGSMRTTRRIAVGEPDAIAHMAEDAGYVRYAGIENGATQWRDRETGSPISLEEIEGRWGVSLRAQSGIRTLDRLPLNDKTRQLAVDLLREVIPTLPDGSERRNFLVAELEKLERHPIDSMVADFAGVVPTYMRDSLYEKMGMTRSDLNGSRLGGAHHKNVLQSASDQTRLYLWGATEVLNQLGGRLPNGQPGRTLPDLYPHSRKVGFAFGAAFEGWDALVKLIDTHRRGGNFGGLDTPLPDALISHPPAVLSNMLGPQFNYNMLKKKPGALRGIVPPDMDPRIGPNTMGPVYTEVAACASAFYALATGANALTTRLPGQWRPDLMILGASDAALSPLVTPFIITAFSDVAPISRARLNELGLTPAQASMPFNKNASGLVISEAAGGIGLTTLSSAVTKRQLISAIVAGWGLSLGEGGKEMLMGMDEGSVGATLDAINMGIEGHGLTHRDVTVVQAHGTSTPLNGLAELISLYKAFASYGGEAHLPILNALKGLIGHAMGAASIVDLLNAVATLREQRAPGLSNFSMDQIDPRLSDPTKTHLPVDLAKAFRFPTETVQEPIEAVLGISEGFGSRNSAVLLKRFDPTILRHYDWPGEMKPKVEDFIAAWPDIVAQYEAEQMELRSGQRTRGQLVLDNAYPNPTLK